MTVALSLGELGHRVDWALLRGGRERMGDRLVLLLIGAWHEDELRGDEDFAACARRRTCCGWAGATDEDAARLMLRADVGIVPSARTRSTTAGLPYRILKAARLGRRTMVPSHLEGARTWVRQATVAPDADDGSTRCRRRRGRARAPTASCASGRWPRRDGENPLRARMREPARLARAGQRWGQSVAVSGL